MAKKIKIVSLIIFAVLSTLGAGKLTHPAETSSSQINRSNFNLQGNAAFRDGIYQGKLAAARGEREHLSVGRWSDRADREAFVAGYRQSYSRQNAVSK